MRLAFLLFALAYALLVSAPAFAAAPPVVPGVVGEVSMQFPPRVVRGDAGWHIWWFYRDSDLKLYSNGFSCPHGVCDRSKLAQTIEGIMTAPDRIAALNAAWDANITYQCKDVLGEQTPRGAACRERGTTFETNKAVWLAGYVAPAVEVWTVKPNGTQPTRPVQKISETNGLTATTERIAVGKPCYPAVRSFQSSAANTYMAIDPLRPDRVAVCAKS